MSFPSIKALIPSRRYVLWSMEDDLYGGSRRNFDASKLSSINSFWFSWSFYLKKERPMIKKVRIDLGRDDVHSQWWQLWVLILVQWWALMLVLMLGISFCIDDSWALVSTMDVEIGASIGVVVDEDHWHYKEICLVGDKECCCYWISLILNLVVIISIILGGDGQC